MYRLDCDALRVESFCATADGDPSQWQMLAPPDTWPTTDAQQTEPDAAALADPGVSCCPKHCTW